MSETMSDSEMEENLMDALHLCGSHIPSMVMKAAIELGVFDTLATAGVNAELTADEIAGKLQVSSTVKAAALLDRMLGFLASHSVLTCSSTVGGDGSSGRRYGLTPVSRFMAKSNAGISLAPYFLFLLHVDYIHSWHYLKAAVQEGVTPFKRAHGASFYEHLTKNPSIANIFNEGMEMQSNLVTEYIFKKYDDGFMEINELIDVGGGTGATLGKIISKFPHIKGVNFDLPCVISQASSIPGVEHVGGDMFDIIPSGGNILLKWILHNWNDEHCLVILKNCWKALPTSGKVIIVDYIIPEIPESNIAVQEAYSMSMMMMNLLDGAKERTENEFRSLAKEACFSEFKILCKFINFHVMEFIK